MIKSYNINSLQSSIIGLFVLIIISFYTYAAVVYGILGNELLLHDPKSLPFSSWSSLNLFLWVFGVAVLITLFVITCFFHFSKKKTALMTGIGILFLLLNYTDPFHVINWLLD